MLISTWFVTVFVASASSTMLQTDDDIFAALLKRQAPGTPSYNCHDNCGTAITLSRQSNKCDNDAFKTNYSNCLQCAGPDNYNIWNMYGRTLGPAGSSCGLKTEPLSGKQPDVGPAVHTGSASATASAAASTAPSPAAGSSSVSSIPSTATSSGASASSSASRNATTSVTSSTPPQQTANAGAQFTIPGAAGAFRAMVVAMVVL